MDNIFQNPIEDSLELPLDKISSIQCKEKNNQEDNFSRFEEFSLSSESLRQQKNDEFELETLNSEEHNSKSNKDSKLIGINGENAFIENSQEISNSKLRKKVCLKMYKVLDENYRLEKGKEHKIILNLESKIRKIHPDMKNEYKSYCINIMKMFKEVKFSLKIIVNFFQL